MAVLLEWDTVNEMDEPYTPPGGLAVVGNHNTVLYNPSTQLTPADASHIEPLKIRGCETNPLLGFLKSIN